MYEREQERRRHFGKKRSTGARRIRGADWGSLRVLRDLLKHGPVARQPSACEKQDLEAS